LFGERRAFGNGLEKRLQQLGIDCDFRLAVEAFAVDPQCLEEKIDMRHILQ